jgi:N-acetylneuraminate synthase
MIIAEIGLAHDGSIGIAHSFVDALAETGVDVIKFQTHIAEAESSKYEKFRINFSYKDKTRFDYWKRMEFSLSEWKGLKEHVEELNMEFMSTATCIESFKLLEKIGVKRYKVGSGDTNNFLLLERISKTGKPIIISNGMTGHRELDKTMKFLKNKKNDISLLQCYTSYPTLPKHWELSEIPILKKKYKIPIGFSDHSGNIFSSLAATALGAEIIEFHVCFDKKMFGPDAESSLTINQVSTLVAGINDIRNSLKSTKINKNDKKLKSVKDIFSKSLALKNDINKGAKISINDLESKKPANMGIPAHNFKKVLGKKLKKNMNRGEFLNLKDIEK